MKYRAVADADDPQAILQGEGEDGIDVLLQVLGPDPCDGLDAQAPWGYVVVLRFSGPVMLLVFYIRPGHGPVVDKLLQDLPMLKIRPGQVKSEFPIPVQLVKTPYGGLPDSAAQ